MDIKNSTSKFKSCTINHGGDRGALPLPSTNKLLKQIVMEKTVKIKCSCGNRFKVTKNDAVNVDWDFTGPDYYKFKCSKCGRNHFVSSFSL